MTYELPGLYLAWLTYHKPRVCYLGYLTLPTFTLLVSSHEVSMRILKMATCLLLPLA